MTLLGLGAAVATSAWADTDPVPAAVAAMVAASDAASRLQVLRGVMGKATDQADRQALGQLLAYTEAVEAAGMDLEQVRSALARFAESPADRDRLLSEARRPAPAAGFAAAPPLTASTGSVSSSPLLPPRLAPTAAGGASADEVRALLERAAAAPDPAAAALLSATVGFGAGHFYARQPAPAWTHLGVQSVAGAALVAGLATSGDGEWSALATAGLVSLVLARGVDVATAPGSAHRTAADAFR